MIQTILVVLIFAGALIYVGSLVIRSFQSRSCVKGCGKCGAIDFARIESQIKAGKERNFQA